MNTHDLDPTTVASDEAADAYGHSLQSGVADVPPVGDDPLVRTSLDGIDRVERAMETTEPLRKVEDALDKNPDEVRVLMANIGVLASVIQNADLLPPDIRRMAIAIGHAALPVDQQLCRILTHAAGIKNRVAIDLDAPAYIAVTCACTSIVEKVETIRRLLEASP